MLIVGTDGYIELRKTCDITREAGGGHVYVVTRDGEYYDQVEQKFPILFYHRLIADCRDRTDTAVSQQRAFQAITLAIQAQSLALQNRKSGL